MHRGLSALVRQGVVDADELLEAAIERIEHPIGCL